MFIIEKSSLLWSWVNHIDLWYIPCLTMCSYLTLPRLSPGARVRSHRSGLSLTGLTPQHCVPGWQSSFSYYCPETRLIWLITIKHYNCLCPSTLFTWSWDFKSKQLRHACNKYEGFLLPYLYYNIYVCTIMLSLHIYYKLLCSLYFTLKIHFIFCIF